MLPFIIRTAPILPRIIVPLIASLLALANMRAPLQAAEQRTFIIRDIDGYGINECLVDGTPCGRVVADAWCEAHGLARAVAFGLADDVTATVEKTHDAATTRRPSTQGAVLVTCAE